MASTPVTSLVPEKACWRSMEVMSFTSVEANGGVGVDLVALRLRLGLVFFVDVLDRTFANERAWQDHHADKAAGLVARGLREHRVGPGFIPGAPRSIGG